MDTGEHSEAATRRPAPEDTTAPFGSAQAVRTNRIVGAVLTLTGVLAVVGALRMGVGSLADPGAGSWPLLLGVVLAGTGTAVGVRARRHIADVESFGSATRGPLLGLASIAAYGLVLPLVGFEIASLALLVFWLRGLGRQSWRSSLIGSLLIVLILYLIFVVALAVPIPRIV
ncbi:tripartite tricarboxylate transporter TctB family protein [Brevibacterium album]|uniref:tripartite tricarboxylate transporter TctB family protein n=1 Tax=Brevibacterium album TaxID=417948 RepID=UPI0004249595|nr:tripartite tricarboxylate transporter TctB family protein [Brevibacterium album]